MGEGCAPGSVTWGNPCGNCGTEKSVCTVQCKPGAATCENQGVCAPGSKKAKCCCSGSSTTGCELDVCKTDCQWLPPTGCYAGSNCTGEQVCKDACTGQGDTCNNTC